MRDDELRVLTGACARCGTCRTACAKEAIALVERVQEDIKALKAENPNAPIPIELVTTSASGLDPDISPEAALFQVPRVARERGIAEEKLRELVQLHTEGRLLGLIGEPRVNVLRLNMALDALKAG